MIKINNIDYNNYETKISFNKFIDCNNKRESIAPFIEINIEDKINIYFETIYEDIDNLEINKETDITKYITEIGYNSGNGWETIKEKYIFKITRIEKNNYKIHAEIKDILIDTTVKINKEKITNQEKIIKLINTIEKLFDYFDIDDVIMTEEYNNNLEIFSDKLNELFKEGINKEILEMISKIEKKEIFYVKQVESFKNNKIRKQIVEYLDNLPLYFEYELVKKNIRENYKLAKYVKEKDKLLELLNINEKVILLMDAKYLTEELILNQMKKSNLVTEIFLGLHGKYNNIYSYSMYYKNNKEINKLLYVQSKEYLNNDIYIFINSSELVKNNIDIVKLVIEQDPKLKHYIGNEIKE